jgi:hypothetical protein
VTPVVMQLCFKDYCRACGQASLRRHSHGSQPFSELFSRLVTAAAKQRACWSVAVYMHCPSQSDRRDVPEAYNVMLDVWQVR